MSDTPLVKKKKRLSNDQNKDIALETPHSILKIRQMMRRNSSSSPAYDFTAEREVTLRRSSISGEKRPARQIRFSIDRLSGNDSTSSNTSVSDKEDNNSSSSKLAEAAEEEIESFYSPNVSNRSIRDETILINDSCVSVSSRPKGPRPRRSLRRNSILSHASSESVSEKSSLDENIFEDGQSEIFDSHKKISNISKTEKSLISESLYASSILSSNTSLEDSLINKCTRIDSNENDVIKTNSSDTEDESASDDEKNKNDKYDSGLTKDTTVSDGNTSNLNSSKTHLEKKYDNCSSQSDEIETDIGSQQTVDNEFSKGVSFNINKLDNSIDLSKKEISEDEDDKADHFQSLSNTMDISNLSQNKNNSLDNIDISNYICTATCVSTTKLLTEVDITDDELSPDKDETNLVLNNLKNFIDW